MKLCFRFLFVLSVLFVGCVKDEESSGTADQGLLTMGNVIYSISQGSINSMPNMEKTWVISFQATVQTSTKSGLLNAGEMAFTLELHQLNATELYGNYSLGDLNMDGMISEMDAYEQGYLSEAYYVVGDEQVQLVSGNLSLSESKDVKKQATFDMRNLMDERLTGTVVFD